MKEHSIRRSTVDMAASVEFVSQTNQSISGAPGRLIYISRAKKGGL